MLCVIQLIINASWSFRWSLRKRGALERMTCAFFRHMNDDSRWTWSGFVGFSCRWITWIMITLIHDSYCTLDDSTRALKVTFLSPSAYWEFLAAMISQRKSALLNSSAACFTRVSPAHRSRALVFIANASIDWPVGIDSCADSCLHPRLIGIVHLFSLYLPLGGLSSNVCFVCFSQIPYRSPVWDTGQAPLGQGTLRDLAQKRGCSTSASKGGYLPTIGYVLLISLSIAIPSEFVGQLGRWKERLGKFTPKLRCYRNVQMISFSKRAFSDSLEDYRMLFANNSSRGNSFELLVSPILRFDSSARHSFTK